jgi:hypothetical protein
MVDTDFDNDPDTAFSIVLVNAEMIRLNPGASREELEIQKDILESINLRDEKVRNNKQ